MAAKRGARVGRSRWRLPWGLALVILCCESSAALAVDPKPAEVAKRLATVEDAQRSLAADLGRVQEQLQRLDQHLGEVREDLGQGHEAAQADREQLKEMREEVRGLYVESSGIKGDIAQLRGEIQSVNATFGNFRFSSGALIAVLIVLQLIVVALTLRARS